MIQMFKSIVCYFLGHKPANASVPILVDGAEVNRFYCIACERCKLLEPEND